MKIKVKYLEGHNWTYVFVDHGNGVRKMAVF